MSPRIFFRGDSLVIDGGVDSDTIYGWLVSKELCGSLIAMAMVPATLFIVASFICTGSPLHLLGALCGGRLAVDAWREARLAHWFREHGCQRSAPDAGGAT